MKVSVVNSQRNISIDTRRLKQIAGRALNVLDEPNAELSIYIVDDTEIKNLNYRYRGMDKATDVLAFSMREGQRIKGAEGILGDVVISAQTAAKQARRLRKEIKYEIFLYLVHGILHLVGYNDASYEARKKMERVQNEIFQQVCVS